MHPFYRGSSRFACPGRRGELRFGGNVTREQRVVKLSLDRVTGARNPRDTVRNRSIGFVLPPTEWEQELRGEVQAHNAATKYGSDRVGRDKLDRAVFRVRSDPRRKLLVK